MNVATPIGDDSAVTPVDPEIAFTAYVRANADRLHRIGTLVVGDPITAADLVQETLLRLYPRWHDVEAARYPHAYVRRSMVNEWISAQRRRSTTELPTDVFPDRGEPDAAFIAVLDRIDATKLLDALTPRQRAAVVLRFYEDVDDRTGAQALGCPVHTYRSLIRRALAALRVTMETES